jgi:formylglycine-generating enzyme required for sulfatase activity
VVLVGFGLVIGGAVREVRVNRCRNCTIAALVGSVLLTGAALDGQQIDMRVARVEAGLLPPVVWKDQVRVGMPSGFGLNSLGIRFAQIPAGRFEMGSTIGPGEQPVHPVTVAAFWMGTTEVTQAQWQAVMGSNPSHFQQAGPNAPVEMVSWSDVQGFVARLNARDRDRRYRLPSEAEWEYACRGGSKEDPYGPVEEIAWVKDNSGGTTHPVGLKRPNAYGLYDMFGNVAEWCEDTYYPSHMGAPADASARKGDAAAYHTLRGGGWDLPAFFIHAAIRGPYDPIHRLGFRLVCVPRGP